MGPGSRVLPALGGHRGDTAADGVAVPPWFCRADLPITAQVPQRTGTWPHASPQPYQGHPQPPLFLPGSQPRSRLSSPSSGQHGLACSTHLGVRGSEHHSLGLLAAHRGQDTSRLTAPRGNRVQGRTHHGHKWLMLRAWMNCEPRARTCLPETQGGILDLQGMLPPHPGTRSSPCAGSNISTVLTKWGRE